MIFKQVSRAALLFMIGLTGNAAYAQAPVATAEGPRSEEIDALEPGVDTSAAEPAATPPGDTENSPAEEPELTADVTRSQSGGYVMDRMDLGRTEITGNQELPKVLYIVPWRQSDPGDLMGKPVNSLLDEVLAPLDREEFVRNVDYYDEVHGDREDR